MSFDFFAEGLSQNEGIKFTQQQNNFFTSKLAFLDPQQTKIIPLGQAISLLKFTGLSPLIQKKILDNLKLNGKSKLEYNDMKKIFRGVALAQNRIEPSAININANIKTKLPVLQDDDDEDEDQPPPQHQSTKAQQKQQPTKDQHKNPPLPPQRISQQPILTSQTTNRTSNQNINRVSSENIPRRTSQITQDKSDPINQNLKKFQDYWLTLNTEEGHKISGNQVKRLYGKSQNKKQLAKIWKICSLTEKGYLSKGQLYVFITLMKSSNGHIPSSLTPQMRETIKKFDGQQHIQKKSQPDQNMGISHTFDNQKSQNFQNEKKQPSPPQKLDDFDDFANFAHLPKTKIPSFTQQRKSSQQRSRGSNISDQGIKNKPNQSPQSPPLQIHQLPKTTIQSISNTSSKQLQFLATQLIPQLQLLSQQNKQSTVILQQTNQLLNNVDQTHIFIANKINQIKVTQQDLNKRLNQTCLRMRDTIIKQSQFINILIAQSQKDIQISKQRVGVLQTYASNVQSQTTAKSNQISQLQRNRLQQSKQPINQMQSNITKIEKIKYPSTPQQQQHQQQNSHNRSSIIVKQPIGLFQQHQYQQDNMENQSTAFHRKPSQPVRDTAQFSPKKHLHKIQVNTQYDDVDQMPPPKQKLLQNFPAYGQQQRPTFGNPNSEDISNQQNNNNDGYHWNLPSPHQATMNRAQSQQQIQQDKRQKQKQSKKQQLQKQQQQQQLLLQHQQQQQLLQQQQLYQQQLYQQQLYQQQILQQQMIQQQMNKVQQPQQQPQPQPPTPTQLQQNQQIKKLNMKRARLIQMINYLSPISKTDYPIIVQKVMAMTQGQLDATYAQLYKKYLVKVQEEQQAAKKLGQQATVVAMPNQDQFSTNNFKNTDQPQQTTFF